MNTTVDRPAAPGVIGRTTKPRRVAPSHSLKTWPEFFQVAWVGDKPWEFRRDDRPGGFQERDEIELEEFNPDDNEYSGRIIRGVITYVARAPEVGIPAGYVVFSYRETSREE